MKSSHNKQVKQATDALENAFQAGGQPLKELMENTEQGTMLPKHQLGISDTMAEGIYSPSVSTL